jgi:hypothetical protein
MPTLFTYSIVLFVIGFFIAVAFTADVGVTLGIAAFVGMLFSLKGYLASPRHGLKKDEVQREAEEILRHNHR